MSALIQVGCSDSQEALGANAWAISRGAKCHEWPGWWVQGQVAVGSSKSRLVFLDFKRFGLSLEFVWLPIHRFFLFPCRPWFDAFGTSPTPTLCGWIWSKVSSEQKCVQNKLKSKYIEHHRTSMKWYEHSIWTSMNLGTFWGPKNGLPFGTPKSAWKPTARGIWTFCRAVCLADSLAFCRFAKGPVEMFEVQSIHVETTHIIIYIYYVHMYVFIYVYNCMCIYIYIRIYNIYI